MEKNYIVHGTKRRTSLITTKRIDHLYKDYEFRDSFFIHYLDLTDSANIIRLIMSDGAPFGHHPLFPDINIGRAIKIPIKASPVIIPDPISIPLFLFLTFGLEVAKRG